MRVLIVYYSFTGNTKKVTEFIAEYLVDKADAVNIVRLRPKQESRSFLGKCLSAFFKQKPDIFEEVTIPKTKDTLEKMEIKLSPSEFDIVILGTPVWAFSPAPAMNTYLDRCSGLENKDVILFVTYHSGRGVESCLNYMQSILAKKGVKSFKRFSISQFKVNDKDFILSKIKGIFTIR
ncbi:MAG: NAD(P)H-dependent oxidoreductase [Candidatus Omnitrophica bacterium]|nr:NAD(P)H-dependent oxidoreductase [Candidatus Omnitrophota bacterium]